MSDIFISYKHEEQPIARKLADALEKKGWTILWDSKLRAVAERCRLDCLLFHRE